jgi:DNA polymerase-3 subunit alpha/error-prone DNA polymerase
MSFLTFEDETAIYETVIFPPVYERYGKLLFDQQPLLVSGRVAVEWEAVSVEVERVEVLEARLTGQEAYALGYAEYMS